MFRDFRVFAFSAALLTAACGGEGQPAEDETAAAPPPAEASAEEPHMEAAHAEEHEGEEADHDEHDAHEEDAHADHDHEGHGDEHAGGTAHVHGAGQMSFTVEGATLTADLISPLINFGLAEDGSTEEADLAAALAEHAPLLVPNDAAKCGAPELTVEIEAEGKKDGMIYWTFECEAPGELKTVTTSLIDAFEGFEDIDAVGLKDGGQTGAELTASQQVFTFD